MAVAACALLQAVVAQVMLVGEAQQYVQQAEVPEDLTALEEVRLCGSCSLALPGACAPASRQ